jgi:uncharacterized protein (DUF58 family)
MQYTSLPPRHKSGTRDPRVYADLDELVRLQFKAQGFSFLPRQPVHSILYGRHASRLRGRGLNFEELRRYVPGDDIRNVDWKATARAGEPNVRVFTEEKDRPIWLIVNQRQNMFFGSGERMKSVTAAETAALAAWRGLANGDRIGAMVFDDAHIASFKPQRSRDEIMRILGAIVEKNHALGADTEFRENPSGGPIINEVLRRLLPLAPHDSLICLIGDGLGVDDETQELITRLTAHNDLIFALIYDPMEEELPRAGPLTIGDGVRRLAFNSNSNSLQKAYIEDFGRRLENLKSISRRHAIPLLPLKTTEGVAEQLRRLLGNAGPASRI